MQLQCLHHFAIVTIDQTLVYIEFYIILNLYVTNAVFQKTFYKLDVTLIIFTKH